MTQKHLIQKLQQDLWHMRRWLIDAYDGWNDYETKCRARLQALQDMLDRQVEENWALAQCLADALSENSILERRNQEQAAVIAEFTARQIKCGPQIL